MEVLKKYIYQVRGVSYKPSDVCDNEKGVPILRAGNICDNRICLDDIVCVDSSKIRSEQILRDGDVLICASSGSKSVVGKAAIYKLNNFISAFGAFCKVVRIKEDENVIADFIRLYFSSKFYREQISNKSQGANINNIKAEDIDSLLINIPDIQTQNIAVFELDKIQAALDNKKEQLKKLDELIQSKFYEMFGDLNGEPTELNKVIDVVSGLVNPNIEPYCSQYHIGPGNIVSNTGEIVDCKLVKDEGLISNKYAFKKGMILYSKIRPNLNKVAIPKFDGVCSADMYPLILKESVVDAFIWKLLSSQDFLVYAIKHSGRARMPKLNRETLLAYKFILPPLPLQQAFAAYVEKVEQAKAIVNQEIAHLQELLNSRMDYYFRK